MVIYIQAFKFMAAFNFFSSRGSRFKAMYFLDMEFIVGAFICMHSGSSNILYYIIYYIETTMYCHIVF